MAAPQGLATFPGLTDFLSVSGTLAHGIAPSIFTWTAPPHTNFVAQVGDLEFSFSNRRVRFRDCAVTHASLSKGRGGNIWTLMLMDRRWKWAFGEISGRYNVRKIDDSIDPLTEKTPQQLAKIFLEAMGEQGANVAKLPNAARPEMVFDAANPAQMLQELCDGQGCRIVLGLDNRVRIWPIGEGPPLPEGETAINLGYGFKRDVRPDKLKVIGGPVQIQAKFELEAVGLETDGRVLPIDQLSYKPAGGWESQFADSFTDVTATYQRDGKELDARDLALESVYRWYRVKQFSAGNLKIPGLPKEQLASIDDVLLGDSLIETSAVVIQTAAGEETVLKPRPPIVEGVFWKKDGGPFENTLAGTTYINQFSVDAELKLVVFDESVTKVDLDASSEESAAELYLTIAFTTRKPKTGGTVNFTHERELPGKKLKTGARLLQHPEITRTIVNRYTGNNVLNSEDNLADVQKEAKHYLDAAAGEYDLEASNDVQYAGLELIEPSGAIEQVSFAVGTGGCYTRASRNAEHDRGVTPYKEVQRRQRQAVALQEQKRDRVPGRPGAGIGKGGW